MSDIFKSDEPTKKPKRKLTQKQLDALAKGRARASERRKQKKLNDNLEKEAVKVKKEQRAVAKNLSREQELLEMTIIREKEEKARNEIIQRKERWIEARLHALSKCKTTEQFKQVSEILDKAELDDFKSQEGITSRFKKHMNPEE